MKKEEGEEISEIEYKNYLLKIQEDKILSLEEQIRKHENRGGFYMLVYIFAILGTFFLIREWDWNSSLGETVVIIMFYIALYFGTIGLTLLIRKIKKWFK